MGSYPYSYSCVFLKLYMLHEPLQSATPSVMVKIVARQAAAIVAKSRIGSAFRSDCSTFFSALQRVAVPLQQVSPCFGFKTLYTCTTVKSLQTTRRTAQHVTRRFVQQQRSCIRLRDFLHEKLKRVTSPLKVIIQMK